MLLSITALILTLLPFVQQDPPHLPDSTMPYLNPGVIVVPDTGKYESYRVKVMNPGDSLVVIESIQPSCGCLLATVQRSRCTRETPGDIYVAVTVARMDSLQPVTIDVFTNRNRHSPLRLTLWRQTSTGNPDPSPH